MRPRIRTIKPEIWQDERVGNLSVNARLLFIGLVTMADDEGRLRELPAAITGYVFPYDDVPASKVVRWLEEIAGGGMILRYEVGGGRYIALRRWAKHQRVDRPSGSDLPPPPDDGSSKPRDDVDEESTKDRRGDHDDSIPTRARASRSDPDTDPIRSSVTDDVRELFECWQERCGHQAALLTPGRRRKIEQRLKQGYTGSQIREAIDGAARAPFVNDAGKRFDDIELICRNGEKLESFIERATATPLRVVGSEKASVSSLLQKLNHADPGLADVVDADFIEEGA